MLVLFHILGPVRVHVHGQTARIGATKVRALLGILLLSPNVVISISTLVRRLWDESEAGADQRPVKGRNVPPTPHKTLQIYATRLRAALREAGHAATLHTEQRAYRLTVNPETVDYHRFRALAAEGRQAARQGNQDRAATAFAAAIDLWQGPPLADLDTPWAQAQRDTMINQDLLPAYHGLFEAYLALGRYEQVIERLAPLLAEYETDETLAGLWMRAAAAVNGPDKLPGFFRAFTERLRAELSADPSEWLVHLYESLTRHQPAAAPIPQPVSASRQPPGQVPRPTPYFTGRQDVLARLDRLMLGAIPPIIAIDGAPGIGKTALVAVWAGRRPFRDGNLFMDLGGYGPAKPIAPAAVLAAFLNTLDVPPERVPSDTQDRARLLRQLLTGRHILIVLDNVRDSDHVRPILAATAPCAVLITSRQQLTGLVHRDGAHRITLSGLTPGDSIAVLSGRIGSERARRDHTAIEDVAAMCQGLPLGLRIAAEHVASRPDAPVRGLAEQLRRQRRILLDTGSHGDDDTVTLRAMFSCSYNALPAEARRLFRLLGILPGMDFSLSAAAALATRSLSETQQMLEVLLGANLVEQPAADRLKLHDLLHLFATDLISSEPREAVRAAIHRILDWYLGTTINSVRQVDPYRVEVPQLPLASGIVPHTFQDKNEALQWGRSERDNILAIARISAAEQFHDHTWRLVGEFDDLLHRWGDPGDLVNIHQLALKSARLANSREGEAGILNNIGSICFYLKDYDQAAQYLRKAQFAHRQLGDVVCEAVSLMNIATTYAERGRPRAAINLYEHSIDLFQQADDDADIAHAYHRMGDTYLKMRRYESAARCYEIALRLRQGRDHERADTLTALGILHLIQGHTMAAIGYCESALLFHRRFLNELRTAETLETLSKAYCQIDRYSDAIPLANEAARHYKAINDSRGQARSLRILGDAQNVLGDHTHAHDNWTAALQLFSELNDPDADTVRDRLEHLSIVEDTIPEPRTTPITASERGQPAAPHPGSRHNPADRT